LRKLGRRFEEETRDLLLSFKFFGRKGRIRVGRERRQRLELQRNRAVVRAMHVHQDTGIQHV